MAERNVVMTYSKKIDRKAHRADHVRGEFFSEDDGVLTKDDLSWVLGRIVHDLEQINKKTERFARSPRRSEKYREICEVTGSEVNAKQTIFMAIFKAHACRFARGFDLETLAWWRDFQKKLGERYVAYLSAEGTPEAYEHFKAHTVSDFWTLCDQYLCYEDADRRPILR